MTEQTTQGNHGRVQLQKGNQMLLQVSQSKIGGKVLKKKKWKAKKKKKKKCAEKT